MIFMAASMEKTMRKKYSSFSCGRKCSQASPLLASHRCPALAPAVQAHRSSPSSGPWHLLPLCPPHQHTALGGHLLPSEPRLRLTTLFPLCTDPWLKIPAHFYLLRFLSYPLAHKLHAVWAFLFVLLSITLLLGPAIGQVSDQAGRSRNAGLRG